MLWEFKGRQFEGEIILWAVRWYCRYGISYRDLEQMMGERGVPVDHSTIYRWVQKYAPEIEKRLRWQWRRPQSPSWRVDKTYVKVRGKWVYLYRALDKHGNMIDFYLSPTRTAKAAKRFLGKALNGLKDWEMPEVERAFDIGPSALSETIALILQTAWSLGKESLGSLRPSHKFATEPFNLTQDTCGEARIGEHAFGLGASALAEAVALIGEQVKI